MDCTATFGGNGAIHMIRKNRNYIGASKKRTKSLSVRTRRTITIPPDPDGYFAMMAGRGKQVLAAYDRLANDFDWDELVGFLILDLMHLCDRNPKLGGIHKAYFWAIDMYERLVEESYEMSLE